ncbi:hypothetical protein [Rathayibacter rathayi]|uniref:hypothetical protein n=1 Tax=Rathayibacter rathayi TaxID=33887 RepID=UPI000CE91281|nr:hypothetical protein [Rathayibacter rathayi]PPF51979.1 hypothetical protein C5C08_01090 [Rathayibacter rathayi]PPF83586.1 hypothetical protein C5C14_01090 [Rathayibacter rathayi]PPG16147.1 hypothetical protein C5C11_00355 [Rathayibacter rathayi]PPG47405.1 hypothetical protein C5C20_01095 [Rathayibacter rathayi]PPI04970.1 hypothetical protein C5C43_01095 [Rathayibacter rathayi]
MSIPSILYRAAETAGQHFAGPGRPWPVIPYEYLQIKMRPGIFRPRFYVTYSPSVIQSLSPSSAIEELHHHLFLSVTLRTPGNLKEWLTYQGWLSGRRYEAESNETR